MGAAQCDLLWDFVIETDNNMDTNLYTVGIPKSDHYGFSFFNTITENNHFIQTAFPIE
jgi:hypothetical protein